MTVSRRIAIIFDFDDTLAVDSTSSFLESVGVDVPDFWSKHRQKLALGWDPMPAYLEMMLTLSRSDATDFVITREKLISWGAQISCHRGLSKFFDRVRTYVEECDSEAIVEFFIISSGVGEIIRNFRYRKHFSDIWACDFSYNQTGEISAIKNVVSFTDKTRFLFQIQKGIIGVDARKNPFDVNKKVDLQKVYVPFSQMIFVGDGYTDIPCFSLLKKNGGIPIGVYDRDAKDRWGKAWGLMEEKRVSHMVAADFSVKSGLDDAIHLAIRQILSNDRFS